MACFITYAESLVLSQEASILYHSSEYLLTWIDNEGSLRY
jgi:hypothetical protein